MKSMPEHLGQVKMPLWKSGEISVFYYEDHEVQPYTFCFKQKKGMPFKSCSCCEM
jgi:hypothetical protein